MKKNVSDFEVPMNNTSFAQIEKSFVDVPYVRSGWNLVETFLSFEQGLEIASIAQFGNNVTVMLTFQDLMAF